MFSLPSSKVYSPWSLGQARTLGRALDMGAVSRTIDAWKTGDFGGDEVAALVAPPLLADEALMKSDLWGPMMLKDAWDGRMQAPTGIRAERALSIAETVTRIQVEALPGHRLSSMKVADVMESLASNRRLKTLLALSAHIRRAVETSFPPRNRLKMRKNPSLIPQVVAKYSKYRVPGTSLEFYFTGGPVFVRFKEQLYVSSHDHLLCYAGKVDTLCTYAMIIPWMGQTYISDTDVENLYLLISKLQGAHISLDQEFFACAKLLDGLCQAYFLMRPAVDGAVNRLMLDAITASVADKPNQLAFVEEMGVILEEMSAPALIEASSIGKSSGHPTVDIRGGMEQLKERTHNERGIDPELVAESVRCLKKRYISAEIVKNKVWPPLLPGASEAVCALKTADALPDGPQAAALNIVLTNEDWDSIDPAPTRESKKLTSLLPYIKDKTISLNRTDAAANYLCEELRMLADESTRMSPQEMYQKTALVLYVLLTQNLNESFKEFLDALVASPTEDVSSLLVYLVIKVVPKEGELKSMARLFGEKTFNYRLHSILQEITAAEFLDEVFPQDQSMTCGELELKRRLHVLTTMKPPSTEYEHIYLVTDVSGWNNGFRHESVGPLGKVLDQIHGTTIFEKTHKLYENSLVYNKDGQIISGWEGQLGGIEGLNQDTWVIVYLAQMHAIFSQLPYSYRFMDCGDNFVAQLAVPRQALVDAGGPAQFAMDLSHRLSVKIKSFGHDAKPDESTCSHSAFIFCHEYRVRGIQMPSHLRKAARMSGITDAFFPFLENYIGGAFSNAHATAEQGVLAAGSFHCAVIWSASHILNDAWDVTMSRGIRFRNLFDSQIAGLLMIPSVLGGFPILYLETMFLRSEADHLPQCIRLWQYCRARHPDVAEVLGNAIRQERDDECSLLTLLADPRALCLTKPINPMSILRAELDGRLARTARNEEIRRLYDTYDDSLRETLVEALQGNTVWPARLMAAIYGASGFAAREGIVACFESSRTAIAFLLHTRPYRVSTPNLCFRAMTAAIRLDRWRRDLVVGSVEDHAVDESLCPTEIAEALREYHWRMKVTTITAPPMGHLFSLEHGGLVPPGESYIQLRCAAVIDRCEDISDHLVMGPYEPTLGHTTSSATRQRMDLVRSKDSLLDGALNLAVVRSWAEMVDEDGSLRKLIDLLLAAYTDVPAQDIQIVSGVRSHGSIEHHLRSRGFNPTIAPNSQTSWLSLITHDTRQAVEFQKGVKYAVNFLEEILFAEYMILSELQVDRRLTCLNSSWVLKLNPCRCFKGIGRYRVKVRQVGGLNELATGILPDDTRVELTTTLRSAIESAGCVGVMSHHQPSAAQAAIGLVLTYWADLTLCIGTAAAQEASDAYTWRQLVNLKGVRAPKEISLNVLRRIPPIALSQILIALNYCTMITEQRRLDQVGPVMETCHAPGTAALTHMTRVISEGVMVGPLLEFFPNKDITASAHVPILYSLVWSSELNDSTLLHHMEIWLPADIDFHSFISVARIYVSAYLELESEGNRRVHAGHARDVYGEWERVGQVTTTLTRWARILGLGSCSTTLSLRIHRISPTAAHDISRGGRTHYPLPAPMVPPLTRPEWLTLRGFEKSLLFRLALRDQEDAGRALVVPPGDEGPMAMWVSTTKSPSRLAYVFTKIGLRVPYGIKVACVGDGLGGNSEFFGHLDRQLLIYYSTLFQGSMNEQPPGALIAQRGQISDQYHQINLRDVTDDIWAKAYRKYPEIAPDLLVCDAELKDYDLYIKATDCLGKAMRDHPTMLVMMRTTGCDHMTAARIAARWTQYARQVQYVPFPRADDDGMVVARYGDPGGARKFITEGALQTLEEQLAATEAPTTRDCLRWLLSHGVRDLPIAPVLKMLNITALHVHDRATSQRLVRNEVDRLLTTAPGVPRDLATASKIIPVLEAICPSHPDIRRFSPLLPGSFERLMAEGQRLRKVLQAMVAEGLLPADAAHDTDDDDLFDNDI